MVRTLIEGSDYFVHLVRFANTANPAAAVLNDDGTYDIYLNTLFPCWDEAMPHELIHVAEDHHLICVAIKDCEERADHGKMRVKCAEPGVVSVLISPILG